MQEKNEDTSEPKPTDWVKYLKIAMFAVFLMWLALGAVTFGLGLLSTERSGQIGDMFGLANSLFSGLAFAGLLVTMWMQKEELTLQRKVSTENTNEIKRQAKYAERSYMLSTIALMNESFMKVSDREIRHDIYITLRDDFVENHIMSRVIEFPDPTDQYRLWDSKRNDFLSELDELKHDIETWLRANSERINGPLILELHGDLRKRLGRYVGTSSHSKWSSAFMDWVWKLDSVKELIDGAMVDNRTITAEFTSVLKALVVFIDITIFSERQADLKSIYEKSSIVIEDSD